MSFGWSFLIYILIGIVCRIVFFVIVEHLGHKNKDFQENSEQVVNGINDLIDDYSQHQKDPMIFRFLVMVMGYVLWPLDLAGFAKFLFPPKE